MRFRVGDLIYNKITQEQGRVVRIVKKNDGLSCVVVVSATPLQGEKEALWLQHEVEDDPTKRRQSGCESASL
jgi:hypothetical protein